jgi:hypothetical protein
MAFNVKKRGKVTYYSSGERPVLSVRCGAYGGVFGEGCSGSGDADAYGTGT